MARRLAGLVADAVSSACANVVVKLFVPIVRRHGIVSDLTNQIAERDKAGFLAIISFFESMSVILTFHRMAHLLGYMGMANLVAFAMERSAYGALHLSWYLLGMTAVYVVYSFFSINEEVTKTEVAQAMAAWLDRNRPSED